jgi:hypothetical protein
MTMISNTAAFDITHHPARLDVADRQALGRPYDLPRSLCFRAIKRLDDEVAT